MSLAMTTPRGDQRLRLGQAGKAPPLAPFQVTVKNMAKWIPNTTMRPRSASTARAAESPLARRTASAKKRPMSARAPIMRAAVTAKSNEITMTTPRTRSMLDDGSGTIPWEGYDHVNISSTPIAASTLVRNGASISHDHDPLEALVLQLENGPRNTLPLSPEKFLLKGQNMSRTAAKTATPNKRTLDPNGSLILENNTTSTTQKMELHSPWKPDRRSHPVPAFGLSPAAAEAAAAAAAAANDRVGTQSSNADTCEVKARGNNNNDGHEQTLDVLESSGISITTDPSVRDYLHDTRGAECESPGMVISDLALSQSPGVAEIASRVGHYKIKLSRTTGPVTGDTVVTLKGLPQVDNFTKVSLLFGTESNSVVVDAVPFLARNGKEAGATFFTPPWHAAESVPIIILVDKIALMGVIDLQFHYNHIPVITDVVPRARIAGSGSRLTIHGVCLSPVPNPGRHAASQRPDSDLVNYVQKSIRTPGQISVHKRYGSGDKNSGSGVNLDVVPMVRLVSPEGRTLQNVAVESVDDTAETLVIIVAAGIPCGYAKIDISTDKGETWVRDAGQICFYRMPTVSFRSLLATVGAQVAVALSAPHHMDTGLCQIRLTTKTLAGARANQEVVHDIVDARVVNPETSQAALACLLPASRTSTRAEVTASVRFEAHGEFHAVEGKLVLHLPAQVATIEPKRGPVAGGTMVTIRGAGFKVSQTADAVLVKFTAVFTSTSERRMAMYGRDGLFRIVPAIVVSDNELTCSSPSFPIDASAVATVSVDGGHVFSTPENEFQFFKFHRGFTLTGCVDPLVVNGAGGSRLAVQVNGAHGALTGVVPVLRLRLLSDPRAIQKVEVKAIYTQGHQDLGIVHCLLPHIPFPGKAVIGVSGNGVDFEEGPFIMVTYTQGQKRQHDKAPPNSPPYIPTAVEVAEQAAAASAIARGEEPLPVGAGTVNFRDGVGAVSPPMASHTPRARPGTAPARRSDGKPGLNKRSDSILNADEGRRYAQIAPKPPMAMLRSESARTKSEGPNSIVMRPRPSTAGPAATVVRVHPLFMSGNGGNVTVFVRGVRPGSQCIVRLRMARDPRSVRTRTGGLGTASSEHSNVIVTIPGRFDPARNVVEAAIPACDLAPGTRLVVGLQVNGDGHWSEPGPDCDGATVQVGRPAFADGNLARASASERAARAAARERDRAQRLLLEATTMGASHGSSSSPFEDVAVYIKDIVACHAELQAKECHCSLEDIIDLGLRVSDMDAGVSQWTVLDKLASKELGVNIHVYTTTELEDDDNDGGRHLTMTLLKRFKIDEPTLLALVKKRSQPARIHLLPPKPSLVTGRSSSPSRSGSPGRQSPQRSRGGNMRRSPVSATSGKGTSDSEGNTAERINTSAGRFARTAPPRGKDGRAIIGSTNHHTVGSSATGAATTPQRPSSARPASTRPTSAHPAGRVGGAKRERVVSVSQSSGLGKQAALNEEADKAMGANRLAAGAPAGAGVIIPTMSAAITSSKSSQVTSLTPDAAVAATNNNNGGGVWGEEDSVAIGKAADKSRKLFAWQGVLRRSMSADLPSWTPDVLVAATIDWKVLERRRSRMRRIGDKGLFEGQLRGRLWHGVGLLTFIDRIYVGQFVDGHAAGLGRMKWTNGDLYTGQFSRGVPSGPGVKKWADGGLYNGQWMNGEMHGEGVFTDAHGRKYIGAFVEGRAHGKGSAVLPWGDQYYGFWENGHEEGHGVFVWADGRRYEGSWHDGKRHGLGVQQWPDGTKYAGMWDDGQQHGAGELVRPPKVEGGDPVVMSGEWHLGKVKSWELDAVEKEDILIKHTRDRFN